MSHAASFVYYGGLLQFLAASMLDVRMPGEQWFNHARRLSLQNYASFLAHIDALLSLSCNAMIRQGCGQRNVPGSSLPSRRPPNCFYGSPWAYIISNGVGVSLGAVEASSPNASWR